MQIILDENTKVTALPRLLLPWFDAHKRPLPWRKSYHPYEVWISEIMLQQTQMERGVLYFERWMERFPDVSAVAAASEEEVLRHWEGLGYYSRARHVHKAAKHIMEKHSGTFPQELEDIRALPGVGPYTAGAIASIAFGHPLPCVDANVERVLARVFDLDSPVKQEPAASRVRALALGLVLALESEQPGKTREHNQAMMELGALVCRKSPLCQECPLCGICESHRLGIMRERPVPGKKSAITPMTVVTGVLWHEGRVFVQKRLNEGVWARLWEFPGGRVEAEESPEAAIVREFDEETSFSVGITHKLTVIRHGYTTYRITLHCFALTLHQPATAQPEAKLTAASECRWVTLRELEELAMPAAHRKLADMLEPPAGPVTA